MAKQCFYCDDTGFIKGKEVRPQDKLPEQICPYCEIGQAVYRGYKKASETQVNNYDKLKASHEKLKEYAQHLSDCNLCSPIVCIKKDGVPIGCTCGFEQALKEAAKCETQS